MKEIQSSKKILSQHLIDWYLTIGSIYGTLSKQQALTVSGVNYAIFQQWLTGKRSAPAIVLERIKLSALGYCQLPRDLASRSDEYHLSLLTIQDVKTIGRDIEFKKQLLNQANPITQKRIFKRLKQTHKFKY